MSDTQVQLTSPRFRDNQRLQQAANNNPPIRSGEQGLAVQLVQKALIELGFSLPISTKKGTREPDGVFGAETRDAVVKFQRVNDLVDDGILGKNTLQSLDGYFQESSSPTVIVVSLCPAEERYPATSYNDYARLAWCVEGAVPDYSPRTILSLLRQLYYGAEDWSRNKNSHWREVIPCGTKFSNIQPLLDNPSLKTLKKSQVVKDAAAGVTTDIGHVFTGLEAMTCLTDTVELLVGGLTYTVEVSNEEFATWIGDLGSAVAQKAVDDLVYAKNLDWKAYFGDSGPANYADLDGDIDSYAIRQALTKASCEHNEGYPIPLDALTQPISKLLEEYYAGGSTLLGAARNNRYTCFAKMLSAQVAKSVVVNKAKITQPIATKVAEFAAAAFVGQFAKLPVGKEGSLLLHPMRISGVLDWYSSEITNRFLDWIGTKSADTVGPEQPVDDFYTRGRKYYTDRAYENAFGNKDVKWEPEDGYQANRARILQLYTYYQHTFDANQGQFLWAGLGRMAGGAVVGGLDLFSNAPYIDPGFLTTTMVRIGKEIFLDLAWQHEAFLADAANAMRLVREHDVRHAAKVSYAAAWEKIISENTEAIAEGNRMLLENEQFSIIQPYYNQLRRNIDSAWFARHIRAFTGNIHPYHRDFLTVFQSGDVTLYADRWQWIMEPGGMWEKWVIMPHEERARLVSLSMDELIGKRWGETIVSLLPPGSPYDDD
jgi:hypothetical protein